MKNREWKPIEGYEGLYEVSNLGEVKSLNYNKTGKEKLLSPGKTENGYLHVTLSKNGIKKPVRINRLVYETFVGEIPDGLEVNHIDENKENNRVENLDICSHVDNIRWGTGIVRRAAARSKAVEAIDKVTGRVVYTFPSTQDAERQGLGFNSGHISACCNGKQKSHGGFIWRYTN